MFFEGAIMAVPYIFIYCVGYWHNDDMLLAQIRARVLQMLLGYKR
jgi:hypothetical protein